MNLRKKFWKTPEMSGVYTVQVYTGKFLSMRTLWDDVASSDLYSDAILRISLCMMFDPMPTYRIECIERVEESVDVSYDVFYSTF